MVYNFFSMYSELNSLIILLLLIFIIIPYTILLFAAIWVYKDAKRTKSNAAVWVLIVWIIPFFIGFITYLIFRDKKLSIENQPRNNQE